MISNIQKKHGPQLNIETLKNTQPTQTSGSQDPHLKESITLATAQASDVQGPQPTIDTPQERVQIGQQTAPFLDRKDAYGTQLEIQQEQPTQQPTPEDKPGLTHEDFT